MFHFIKSVLTGKYLAVDASKGANANGTGIIQYDFTGDGTQKWDIDAVPNGEVKIRNDGSGKVIDVPNGTLDHVQVIQFEDHNGQNQLWYLGSIPNSQAVYFQNVATHEYLNVNGASYNNGAAIIQYPGSNPIPQNEQWLLS